MNTNTNTKREAHTLQARNPHSMSRQAVVLSAMLAASTLTAQAQTVVSVSAGQQSIITDPFGSGRSTYLLLLGGTSTTAFGAGDYAVTNEPFDVGGALAWMNVGALQVAGVNGTTISPAVGSPTNRKELRAQTNVGSLRLQIDGSDAGRIDSLSLAGGVSLTGTRITGTLTGGSLRIDAIRANAQDGQVIANLSGTKAAIGTKPAVVYNSPNTVLWTFDPVTDVAGPHTIDAASLFSADPVVALQTNGYTNVRQNQDGTIQFTASTQTNNLTLTSAGASFFTNALGLLATGQDAMNAANDSLGKWGSFSTSLNFVAGVPEPSTYALMGLGLVGIALAARHKKSMQTA